MTKRIAQYNLAPMLRDLGYRYYDWGETKTHLWYKSDPISQDLRERIQRKFPQVELFRRVQCTRLKYKAP